MAKCSKCGKEIPGTENAKTSKPRYPKLKCPYCGSMETFVRATRYLASAGKVKIYQCKVCMKTFREDSPSIQ